MLKIQINFQKLKKKIDSKTSYKEKFLLLLLCLMPMFTVAFPAIFLGSITYFLIDLAYGEGNYFTTSLLWQIILLFSVVGLILSMKNMYKWYRLIRDDIEEHNT